jgi:HD-like signal output (HDOD) protein
MQAAQEFICDLAEKISMPEIYHQIRTLMVNPQAKIEDYEKLVNADSMLAIRVMRIANSEFFGFTRQANDLYQAISLIGIIQLHDLLLSSLCMRTFYGIPEQIFNFNDFWHHGVKCGIASRRIAQLCRIPANNRFFTLGLLLKIGQAAMFIKAPDLTVTVLQQSKDQQQSIDVIERKYFGFDYCQLGAALMRQWHLPDVYPQIIEHQLSPKQIKPDYKDAAEIVSLANHLSEKSDKDISNVHEELLNNKLFSQLPIDFVEIIHNDINTNVDSIFELLSPPIISKFNTGSKGTQQ